MQENPTKQKSYVFERPKNKINEDLMWNLSKRILGD
jgi:hypothetical protein